MVAGRLEWAFESEWHAFSFRKAGKTLSIEISRAIGYSPNRWNSWNFQSNRWHSANFGYNFNMQNKAASRVIERLLEPVCSSLNDEAARKLIGLTADREAQSRIAELAGKCNEGELTETERDEYASYVMAGDVVALLQARTRLLLAHRGQPA
ncbi:MAG TPA: hypothetical protein VMV69_22630 [Pirellulales bacterium]|nr:hypothetical protein [Pirellulales bacterium]